MSMLVRTNAALAGIGPSTSFARTQIAGDNEHDDEPSTHASTSTLLSIAARYPAPLPLPGLPSGQYRPGLLLRHYQPPQSRFAPPAPPSAELHDDLDDEDGDYSDDVQPRGGRRPRQPAARGAKPAAAGPRKSRVPAVRKRSASPDDGYDESVPASDADADAIDDDDDASDSSDRRPLKRARVNAPEPVPNLTKKSRGRRVPRADDAETANEYSARKYICPVADCGKGFSRGEHLKRHTRSIHTNDRPFTCTVKGCGRTFTRHDNLLQHQRAHAAPLLVPLPATP